MMTGPRRIAAAVIALSLIFGAAGPASATPLPDDFDAIPATFDEDDTLSVSSGRTAHYQTVGSQNGQAVLILGTNINDIQIFAHMQTLADHFNLRLVTVGMPGIGHSPYDPALTPQGYGQDILDVLDHLNIGSFSIIAISNNGPIAGHLAMLAPERVHSMHMANAVHAAESALCPAPTPDYYLDVLVPLYEDPSVFLPMFDSDDVLDFIPDYRELFLRLISTDLTSATGTPIGVSHLLYMVCSFPLADSEFSSMPFETYVYHGEDDPAVPVGSAHHLATTYPNSTLRLYPGEGHLSFVRHAGQIFTDIKYGGTQHLLCHNGQTLLIEAAYLAEHVAHGDALDTCAWQDTPV